MISRDDVMRIARAEIGVEEDPLKSNSGPRVNEYLASVGLGPGNPWCAAFTYWVYQNASGVQENPLPKTGYTPSLYQWGVKHERMVAAHDARPGDLVLFYSSHLGRIAHVGIVGQVTQSGLLWSIEGNTNSDGSREGYEVCRKCRPLSDKFHFVNAVGD